MAAFPLPRRRLNQPAFRETVRASDRLRWQIALKTGFRHYSRFSKLINAETVPNTATTIASLERIADVIGFPKSRLFLDAKP
jgi:hypothetical protein